ncbi:hypothetical protein [Microcoleus asticus]|uniref:hypothetical protein n=1 Tax=Microcoleus asticus TaxID=2815231 RepID=UPI001C12E28E|nr:hypothetical protein [Microcoleus asticus]
MPQTARANLRAVKFRSRRRSPADFAAKATGCSERTALTHNLGTLQGDGKNARSSPRLELFAALDFGVIFKLDRQSVQIPNS